MKRRLFGLITPLVSACTSEIRSVHDIIYHVPTNPTRMVVQPSEIGLGEPLTVDVAATLVLDAESNFPEVTLLNTNTVFVLPVPKVGQTTAKVFVTPIRTPCPLVTNS